VNRRYVLFQPAEPKPLTIRVVQVPPVFEPRAITHVSDTLCQRLDPTSAYVAQPGHVTVISIAAYFLVPIFEWDRDPLSQLLEFFVGSVRPVNGDDPSLADFPTSIGVETPQGTYRLHYSVPIGLHYQNTLTGHQGAVLFDHNCRVVSPD
jgi:hypothetical protein